jgi:hypothetical protein
MLRCVRYDSRRFFRIFFLHRLDSTCSSRRSVLGRPDWLCALSNHCRSGDCRCSDSWCSVVCCGSLSRVSFCSQACSPHRLTFRLQTKPGSRFRLHLYIIDPACLRRAVLRETMSSTIRGLLRRGVVLVVCIVPSLGMGRAWYSAWWEFSWVPMPPLCRFVLPHGAVGYHLVQYEMVFWSFAALAATVLIVIRLRAPQNKHLQATPDQQRHNRRWRRPPVFHSPVGTRTIPYTVLSTSRAKRFSSTAVYPPCPRTIHHIPSSRLHRARRIHCFYVRRRESRLPALSKLA